MPSVRRPGSHQALRSIVCAALVTSSVFAQTRDDGTLWLAYIAQGRIDQALPGLGEAWRPWRFWFDAQIRQRDNGEHLDLGVLRPGIGYALNDQLTVYAGYGWFATEPAGRDEFLEHRPWQQLTWNLPVEGFTLQSRTRLEQRFLENRSETGHRLREFVKATIPLQAENRLFVSLWDEVFFDLNDTDWGQRGGFRQNRAFVGLGGFVGEGRRHSWEVGYTNQWIDRRDEDRLNHVVSVNWFTYF